MLLIAGLIYAAGQIMGAETRARANVWATALLTGGIIGLLIAASAPYVLQLFGSFFTGNDLTLNSNCIYAQSAPIGGGGGPIILP
ncbi:Uncharacterised protein [Candidatus Burarchaeum australiense]|nr:Uncharacterised protein [Candidatus Burarchaeum australiense]